MDRRDSSNVRPLNALLSLPRNEISENQIREAYRSVVEQYTESKLSYPGDILSAFAGIAALMEQALEHQGCISTITYGLPEHNIYEFLFWIPKKTTLRRQPPVFPSWSWAGWIGGVTYEDRLDYFDPAHSRILRCDLGYVVTDETIHALAFDQKAISVCLWEGLPSKELFHLSVCRHDYELLGIRSWNVSFLCSNHSI
ncbi:uncharacterized protein BDZ99DRAFT_292955 [Mytilinidion resinicola]|uniref:Uncharacterized protein n=1 Tax=Mytilinidion resinicola TaxID=574789 RepID=A0A6A6YSV1_9PEZI|nr:uncharacterized protein BDZ99DRAFT_292955 [Mytilinidion resinicola]KAF2810997.1 hypothetical protein BDZ99DRAFT_292955 [Mytilinidion resinicola]